MEQVIVYEKVTTWLKHTINIDNVDSYQEALNNVIECYKNNRDPWEEDNMYIIDTQEDPDTEEYLSVSDNGGFSTIEVESKDGQIVWSNGKIC